MPSRTKFTHLKTVFKTLHGPRGCLWDKQQTFVSLIPHFREEVGEFIHEVRNSRYRHMKEELGDILLHVMFYAEIARRQKRFDIEDVIDVLIKKLKRRHPHVFGSVRVKSARQIIVNWNRIKAEEHKKRRRYGTRNNRSRS